MDNILLNTWIELKNGLTARLTRAGAGGSDEKESIKPDNDNG